MHLKFQVSAVTNRLFLGPFLSPSRADYLRELGVTHVLNVGEAPSIINADEKGFVDIRDCPVDDRAMIADTVAIECVNALCNMVSSTGSKVYVHCIAGQNRSPTILWLFLIACGFSRPKAKTLIESAAADAVPGHRLLVDDRLASLIEEHGRTHFASRFSLDDVALL